MEFIPPSAGCVHVPTRRMALLATEVIDMLELRTVDTYGALAQFGRATDS